MTAPHLYLSKCLDLFPADAIGGSNEGKAAPRTVRIQYGDCFVDTDVDKSQQFFRRRKWVREFFEAEGISAGDVVVIEQFEPYLYRISKAE